MKNSFVMTGVGIGLCILALTGCDEDPETKADLMRDDASVGQTEVDLKKQTAKDWERGKELIAAGENRVKQGEAQIESAEENIESGQDTIARGEQEIAEGQKLVRESERKFREDYPEVDLNQTN